MDGRSLIVCGVLALLSGALFRLAGSTGIPVLEMLGFWSLVGVGVTAARAAGRQQVAAGRQEVEACLSRLLEPEEQLVPLPALGGGPEEPLAVVFRGGVALLVPDPMANYGRGRRALRRLAAGQEKAAALARRVGEVVPGGARMVYPCVVLLRRRAPGGMEAGPVPVVNAEGLAAFLERLRRGVADGVAPAAVTERLRAAFA